RVNQTSRQAAELLREYGRRARSVAGSTRLPSRSFPAVPHLIHSLDLPPSDQILTLWRQSSAAPKSLTVLSPFHAPDGGPIYRLADALGVSELQVGIDSKSLIVPLLKNRVERTKVARYVVPNVDGQPRSLHAKVLE